MGRAWDLGPSGLGRWSSGGLERWPQLLRAPGSQGGRAVSPATRRDQSCACLKPGQLAGPWGDDQELGVVRDPVAARNLRLSSWSLQAGEGSQEVSAALLPLRSEQVPAAQSPAPRSSPSQAEALST